jgi:pilus assembly protein CpaD
MLTFNKNMTLALSLIVALGGLNACSRMYKEGTLTQNKMQVSQQTAEQEIILDGSHNSQIMALGKDYSRYGDGTLEMTIAYDPLAKSQGAMRASQMAGDLAAQLRSEGITNVKADILPVKDLPVMKALVNYDSYSALPPEDCEPMSGFNDRNHGDNMDYEMGCTVDTLIARQISRPKDLLGRDFENSYNDARGVSNQIDAVRSGARNPPLGGETTQ